MTPKESTELLNGSRVITWDHNQRFEDTDYYKFRVNKIKKMIKDWQGFEDEKGTPFLCTDENKELLNAYQPEIINWLLKEVEEIEKKEQLELGASSKN